MQTRLETNQRVLKDLSSAILSLKNHVSSMGNSWKGSDYDYFIKNIEPFLKDLNDFERNLNSYHDYIGGYLGGQRKLVESYENKKINLK